MVDSIIGVEDEYHVEPQVVLAGRDPKGPGERLGDMVSGSNGRPFLSISLRVFPSWPETMPWKVFCGVIMKCVIRYPLSRIVVLVCLVETAATVAADDVDRALEL